MAKKECSICLTQINNIDICVTACNHTFHTSCLMRSNNNACPLCRSCIHSGPKSSSNEAIAKFFVDYEEYIKESDKRCDDMEKEREIQFLEREKEYKKKLKEKDIQKYELFFKNSK
jgi:hypothetical protein